MNSLLLAESSAVAILQRNGDEGVYILRCFDCDWGMTLGQRSTWRDVLETGEAHEEEHGKGWLLAQAIRLEKQGRLGIRGSRAERLEARLAEEGIAAP